MKKIFSLSSPSESYYPLAHMIPHVRISPFCPWAFEQLANASSRNLRSTLTDPAFWLDNAIDIQIFNSGRMALWACLRHEDLKSEDEVLIVTTTNGPYISSCVTKTIESVCRWSRIASDKTKVVLVIHEFGFPCPDSVFRKFIKKNLIVIEDCAYATGTRINHGKVGNFGDYAIYSLPKYFPVPLGGVLAARKRIKKIPSIPSLSAFDQKLLKKTIDNSYIQSPQWNEQRRMNWKFFAQKLKPFKIVPYFNLKEKVVPGVFAVKLSLRSSGDKRKKQLNQFGVEATEYYGQEGFYFPVHQFLTEFEKNHILNHFLLRKPPATATAINSTD